MRVISGILKGRNIMGYDIDGTRPTMDRVKESMFATINDHLEDSIFLDLFCGSGNIGIEAISNGSRLCYFVDNNNEACKIVRKNIDSLNINDKSIVLNCDYKKCLKSFGRDNKKFDIIFADPPYQYHVIDKILNLISENDLLSDNGIVVVEFENEKLNDTYGNIKLLKKKKYSWKNVYIFKKD